MTTTTPDNPTPKSVAAVDPETRGQQILARIVSNPNMMATVATTLISTMFSGNNPAIPKLPEWVKPTGCDGIKTVGVAMLLMSESGEDYVRVEATMALPFMPHGDNMGGGGLNFDAGGALESTSSAARVVQYVGPALSVIEEDELVMPVLVRLIWARTSPLGKEYIADLREKREEGQGHTVVVVESDEHIRRQNDAGVTLTAGADSPSGLFAALLSYTIVKNVSAALVNHDSDYVATIRAAAENPQSHNVFFGSGLRAAPPCRFITPVPHMLESHAEYAHSGLESSSVPLPMLLAAYDSTVKKSGVHHFLAAWTARPAWSA